VNPTWLAVAIAFGLTIALIAILLRTRWASHLADHPNERSLHTVPTPRVGGLGLLAGALPVAFAFAPAQLEPLLACVLALALLSLADDLKSLPVAVRLLAHAAAAAIAWFAIVGTMPAAAGAVVTAVGAVLAVMWMTNLFNFMDGADGLAGGMAAIGFAALAVGAYAGGDAGTALACVAIASASLVFLAFNFPPARVFLGDAGAIPLGFAAGAFALHGIDRGLWPAWFVPLVFSPFVVDATVTLARRLARGERVWVAHRSHYYQRLVLAGWSARLLALRAYALMALCAATALAARTADALWQFGILLAWLAAYSLILIAIERHARAVRKTAA